MNYIFQVEREVMSALGLNNQVIDHEMPGKQNRKLVKNEGQKDAPASEEANPNNVSIMADIFEDGKEDEEELMQVGDIDNSPFVPAPPKISHNLKVEPVRQ